MQWKPEKPGCLMVCGKGFRSRNQSKRRSRKAGKSASIAESHLNPQQEDPRSIARRTAQTRRSMKDKKPDRWGCSYDLPGMQKQECIYPRLQAKRRKHEKTEMVCRVWIPLHHFRNQPRRVTTAEEKRRVLV